MGNGRFDTGPHFVATHGDAAALVELEPGRQAEDALASPRRKAILHDRGGLALRLEQIRQMAFLPGI